MQAPGAKRMNARRLPARQAHCQEGAILGENRCRSRMSASPARNVRPHSGTHAAGEKPRSAPRKGPAPARVAALEALMDVQISDAYAGALRLTRRIASRRRLSACWIRRLMTELFYGVLEKPHLSGLRPYPSTWSVPAATIVTLAYPAHGRVSTRFHGSRAGQRRLQ